jgi:hypothetical protein
MVSSPMLFVNHSYPLSIIIIIITTFMRVGHFLQWLNIVSVNFLYNESGGADTADSQKNL